VTEANPIVLSQFNHDNVLREQFEELVNTHRAQAMSTAWRLLGGDSAAAEDVVQEAFLRAHRALSGFRGASAMNTWFFRILLRQISNRRRWLSIKRLWPLSESEQLVDPLPEPERDHGLRRRILQALAKLSARQRSVFVLIHLEGFTVTEVADILECSPGTVKSHLHRALVSLRHSLADLSKEWLSKESV